MRFKLDENLPAEIGAFLRDLGHAADTVNEEGLAGSPDPAVLAAARDEDRIVLTLDKGIGNLALYPAGSHAGVVIFRPGSSGRKAVAEFVKTHLPVLSKMQLQGRVAVVTPTKIRVR
jgi:predicted nuclease of predicted toxin-antitoxin system